MPESARTPEDTARGDIPADYAPALAVSISPDGSEAIVLLGTNGPPDYYPYQEEVVRQGDGWVAQGGGNMCIGAALWDEAPVDAQAAIVAYRGTEHRVPVVDGYFHFSPWDFGFGDLSGTATLERFE